jgi:hypothetical protein
MIRVASLAILVALAVTFATTARAGPATERPDAFLTRIIRYDSLGQYGRAYDLLAPGQKKLISRAHYVDCEATIAAPFDLISMKRLDQYHEPINILGVPQKTAIAVTVRVTIRTAAGKTVSMTRTWHTVWEKTRWAWMLSTTDVRTLHSGRCRA